MFLIDAHNDTAYRMYFEKQGLFENSLQVDLKKQSPFHTLLLYAIFMDPQKWRSFPTPLAYFDAVYEHFFNQLSQNSTHIRLTQTANDLLTEKTPLAMLSVEGGGLISSVETVDYLHQKGVKAVTLTWNDSNALATSQMSGETGGLSCFGKAVIKKMNQLGMIPDVSHASDQTFWEVLSCTEKPILVSHSNSRALCPHPRNITDEMFLALVENGGVLGINFYPPFLGENADISTIFSHIEHFLELGGENHIGFGSDFDGIDDSPQGIEDFSSFSKIVAEMKRRNYCQTLIDKLCYQNMMRILK